MTADAPSTIDCDVRTLAADAVSIQVLARLHLAGRRLGVEIRLRNVSRELEELLVFAGLGEVLGLEAGGQPEEREERLGVEEERELGDPAA